MYYFGMKEKLLNIEVVSRRRRAPSSIALALIKKCMVFLVCHYVGRSELITFESAIEFNHAEPVVVGRLG